MRLNNTERNIIKQAVARHDPAALVYLFGSRVDDRSKGGDIDLHIVSKTIDFKQKLKIKTELYDYLGEQKIDIIITPEENDVFMNVVKKKELL